MAEDQSQSVGVSETQVLNEETEPTQVLQLKLRKPKNKREVKWTTDTVDNEHLNKKKSKCCCIYEKPRLFDESSSDESDDECRSCRGHKDKCFRTDKDEDPGAGPSSEVPS
ncbi:E3 ubiquitin-protein ligase PPP1R11-like [Crassostrea virginica]|uniref:E3 ubiquitin-protein ligase PPP1R11 n=1 Tax=Crassostrea virginica TaxID=6565 RepID=A0A8B8D546_CRAVI|nr:protein phosphatase 1 regulatory subunit 11-like [Crassostrea virginica]